MAEWKPFDLKWGRSIWYCSACEESTEVPTYLGTPMYNFCPMCGADMNMKSENKEADTPQTELTAKCLNCHNAKACKEKHWDGCIYEPQTDCDDCIWSVCNYNKADWDADAPQTDAEVPKIHYGRIVRDADLSAHMTQSSLV